MNVNNRIAGVVLVFLVVTATLPSGMVGTAEADPRFRYTVIQGTECWEVTPYEPYDDNPDGPKQIQPHVTVVERSNELGPYINDSWDGTPTIESIMDYRYRDPPGGVSNNSQAWGQIHAYAPYLNEANRHEGWSYGTYGLWNWSTNQESHMFFYSGPEGDSFVIRHDKLYDSTGIGSHGPYNGMHPHATRDGFMSPQPGRSAVTFIFRDLPPGEWAYMDDLYPEGMDALYYASGEFDYDSSRHTRYGHRHNDYGAVPIENYGGGTDFTAHWTWGEHGTDGGAYRGLENLAYGESIVIEPYFDEESYFWSNYQWRYNRSEGDGITDWVIRRKNQENVHLDKDEPVEIRKGATCPDANLQVGTNSGVSEVEVGERFYLDASASEGSGIQYHWDFDGDGEFEATNGTDSYLSYVYDGNVTDDVTVRLVVEDSDGLRNTATRQIHVEQPAPPDAEVNVSGTNQRSLADHHVVNETLTFDATGTTDNVVVNASSAVWRVDGNVTARGQMQYATAFSETGEHEVSFTVSDEAGHNTTETITVDVDGLDTENPEARAEVTPSTVEAGANVTVDASGSNDNRGIAQYRWDLNADGAIESRQQSLVFQYPSAGTHNVTLEVEDGNGNVANATVPVTVLERRRPNITSVSVPSQVIAGEQFSLTAEAEDNGRIASYQWAIDGEIVATGKSATYRFPEDVSETNQSVYQLIVTDAAGQRNATESIPITVLPPDDDPPNAKLSASTNETRVGNSMTFNASNSTDPPHDDVVAYHWNFDGNGTAEKTTSKPVVSHAYDEAGTYNATVVVEDGSGNRGTATVQVEVKEKRQAHQDKSNQQDSTRSVNRGPPPVMTDVERTGANSVEIDVKNGRSDETVRTSLPESEVASETGVRFESVMVELGGKDAHVVFETAASADPPESTTEPPAPDETLAYLELDARYLDDEVTNATVGFEVQKSELGRYGAASDVAVYRYDGTWTQVNATLVGTTNDAYRFTASPDGLGTLAVGRHQSLSVTDAGLANETVTPGGTVSATATVENEGPTARDLTVKLALDDSVATSKTVTVPAGETVDVTLTGTAPEPGEYDVTVAGVDAGTLAVEETPPADVSVADVSLNESAIEPGETVRITATVENTGGKAGEGTVTLTMFGEELGSKTVRVPAGETKTVTFVRPVDATGSYTVDVNGETATLDVTDSGTSDVGGVEDNDDGPGNPAPDIPGFGLGVTLAALVAAALLALRRR